MKDGTLHSSGHLSFDEYEQDQALSPDANQDGQERSSRYQINDNTTTTLLTPEVFSAYGTNSAMPEGPEKQKAMAAVVAKYPVNLRARASIERETRISRPRCDCGILKGVRAFCCAWPQTALPRCSSSMPRARCCTTGRTRLRSCNTLWDPLANQRFTDLPQTSCKAGI